MMMMMMMMMMMIMIIIMIIIVIIMIIIIIIIVIIIVIVTIYYYYYSRNPKPAMFGLEGEFSKLFNPVYIFVNKTCLYLETFSWSQFVCAERASSQRSGYLELRENMCYLLCFSFIYLFV